MGAAAAGLIIAAVVRAASEVVGTFSVNASHPRASGSQMITNLHHLPSWGASMLGVGGGQLGNGGVPVALEAVHLIGLLVVTGGIVSGTVAMVSGAIRGRASPVEASAAWRLDDLLVVAVFADLVVFLVLTTSDDPGFLRYLTAAVIFGAVLAGRWVGRLAASLPSAVLVRRGQQQPALPPSLLSPPPSGSPFPPRCPSNQLPSSTGSSKLANWSWGLAITGVPRSPLWPPAAS